MKFSVVAALFLFGTTMFAAPPVRSVKPVAPDRLAHPDAMFLSSLCDRGTRRITFKATAIGTHFFLEEPAGVSVYVYDGLGYRREKFIKKTTLEKVLKQYASKPGVKR